eukprot:4302986-Pleurochrysis_carterae.AAC.1
MGVHVHPKTTRFSLRRYYRSLTPKNTSIILCRLTCFLGRPCAFVAEFQNHVAYRKSSLHWLFTNYSADLRASNWSPINDNDNPPVAFKIT